MGNNCNEMSIYHIYWLCIGNMGKETGKYNLPSLVWHWQNINIPMFRQYFIQILPISSTAKSESILSNRARRYSQYQSRYNQDRISVGQDITNTNFIDSILFCY